VVTVRNVVAWSRGRGPPFVRRALGLYALLSEPVDGCHLHSQDALGLVQSVSCPMMNPNCWLQRGFKAGRQLFPTAQSYLQWSPSILVCTLYLPQLVTMVTKCPCTRLVSHSASYDGYQVPMYMLCISLSYDGCQVHMYTLCISLSYLQGLHSL
jgi:hypothetical protein